MCGGKGGSLMKEGKATWWCDTEAVWRKGTKFSNEELFQTWYEQGIVDRIAQGNIHVIWTGGEPTLPRHQKAILEFIDFFDHKDSPSGFLTYYELETNGTLQMSDDFLNAMTQINCSPKLANSGIEVDIRLVEEPIKQIRDHSGGWFKFVVSNETDFEEIQKQWLEPFDIPADQVIIMPGVDNRDDLPERTRFLFEMSMKYGYRAITRQHILAWDKVTGV
jgi:organic radical activating enzyme